MAMIIPIQDIYVQYSMLNEFTQDISRMQNMPSHCKINNFDIKISQLSLHFLSTIILYTSFSGNNNVCALVITNFKKKDIQIKYSINKYLI